MWKFGNGPHFANSHNCTMVKFADSPRYCAVLESATQYLLGNPSCACCLSTGKRVKLAQPLLTKMNSDVMRQLRSLHVDWPEDDDDDEAGMWGVYLILCALKGSMRGAASRGAQERAVMGLLEGCGSTLAADMCSALETQAYGRDHTFDSMLKAHTHVIDKLLVPLLEPAETDQPAEDTEPGEDDGEGGERELTSEDYQEDESSDEEKEFSEEEEDEDEDEDGEEVTSEEKKDEPSNGDENEAGEAQVEPSEDDEEYADVDGDHRAFFETSVDSTRVFVRRPAEFKRQVDDAVTAHTFFASNTGMKMDDRAMRILYDAAERYAVELMDVAADSAADQDENAGLSIGDLMNITRSRPSILLKRKRESGGGDDDEEYEGNIDLPIGTLGRQLAQAVASPGGGIDASLLDRLDPERTPDANLGCASLDDALFAAVASAIEADPPVVDRLFADPEFASRLRTRANKPKATLLLDMWRAVKSAGGHDAWVLGAELVRFIMASPENGVPVSVIEALKRLGEQISHDNPTAAGILARINGLEFRGAIGPASS